VRHRRGAEMCTRDLTIAGSKCFSSHERNPIYFFNMYPRTFEQESPSMRPQVKCKGWLLPAIVGSVSRDRLQPRYFVYTNEQIWSFTIWPVSAMTWDSFHKQDQICVFQHVYNCRGPVSRQSPLMRPQMKCSSWRPPAIVGTVSREAVEKDSSRDISFTQTSKFGRLQSGQFAAMTWDSFHKHDQICVFQHVCNYRDR